MSCHSQAAASSSICFTPHAGCRQPSVQPYMCMAFWSSTHYRQKSPPRVHAWSAYKEQAKTPAIIPRGQLCEGHAHQVAPCVCTLEVRPARLAPTLSPQHRTQGCMISSTSSSSASSLPCGPIRPNPTGHPSTRAKGRLTCKRGEGGGGQAWEIRCPFLAATPPFLLTHRACHARLSGVPNILSSAGRLRQ